MYSAKIPYSVPCVFLLQPNGTISATKAVFWDNLYGNFSSEVGNGKLFPVAVMADLEPTIVDEERTDHFK